MEIPHLYSFKQTNIQYIGDSLYNDGNQWEDFKNKGTSSSGYILSKLYLSRNQSYIFDLILFSLCTRQGEKWMAQLFSLSDGHRVSNNPFLFYNLEVCSITKGSKETEIDHQNECLT